MRSRSTLIFLVAGLLFATSAPAQVTILSRATLIDGTGTPAQKDITIVMENGRIRDIGPAVKTPAPAGATVLAIRRRASIKSICNADWKVAGVALPIRSKTASRRASHSLSLVCQLPPNDVLDYLNQIPLGVAVDLLKRAENRTLTGIGV